MTSSISMRSMATSYSDIILPNSDFGPGFSSTSPDNIRRNEMKTAKEKVNPDVDIKLALHLLLKFFV